MKKIIVLQHVSFELLGHFYPLLKKAGFRIKFVNFSRDPNSQPSMEGYDGLILLGGPMSVNDVDKFPHLKVEIDLIKQAIKEDKPILGICLGAQLIAKALGAEVKKNIKKEIGWYNVKLTEEGKKDPLLSLLGDSQNIFQWHNDIFTLPEGAVRLASTEDCKNQAIRYKNNIYAFQFHLEADSEAIGTWLNVPAHLDELEEAKSYIDPSQVIVDTKNNIDKSTEIANKVFGKFIELFSTKNNTTKLLSR